MVPINLVPAQIKQLQHKEEKRKRAYSYPVYS